MSLDSLFSAPYHLKFDNSYPVEIFLVQAESGRTINVQVLDQHNKVVDVTNLSLDFLVGSSAAAYKTEGVQGDPLLGEFKIPIPSTMVPEAGHFKGQFLLSDSAGYKVGSKLVDVRIEPSIENGELVGKNVLIHFGRVDRAIELLEMHAQTMEEARDLDASLRSQIATGEATEADLLTASQDAAAQNGALQSTIEAGGQTVTSLENAKAQAEQATTTLTSATSAGDLARTSLESATDQANLAKSDLDASVVQAGTAKAELEATDQAAQTTKQATETLLASLETATTQGSQQEQSLQTAITQGTQTTQALDTAKAEGDQVIQALAGVDQTLLDTQTADDNLKATIAEAGTSKTNLEAADQAAQATETIILGLMDQLDLTKAEVELIIAQGDLSQYLTTQDLAAYDLDGLRASVAHIEEGSELTVVSSDPDADGVYKTVTWTRRDGTTYAESTLSGDPYNRLEIAYYDKTGTGVDKTISWNLTIDANGIVSKKELIA